MLLVRKFRRRGVITTGEKDYKGHSEREELLWAGEDPPRPLPRPQFSSLPLFSSPEIRAGGSRLKLYPRAPRICRVSVQLRMTFASLPGPGPGPGHRGSSSSRRVRSADIAAATLEQHRGSYGGKKSCPNSGSRFSAAGPSRRPEKERDLGKLNPEEDCWVGQHQPRQWERRVGQREGPKAGPYQ